MKSRKVLYTTALLSALLVTGCAQQSNTGTSYSRSEARQVQTVRMATVQSVVPVIIEGRMDGLVGSGAGAIIGGIAGSGVGGGSGQQIATVVGAVAGGVAGQRIEEAASRRHGVELTLTLDDGSMISVVQENDPNQQFSPGQRVRILGQGNNIRVSY